MKRKYIIYTYNFDINVGGILVLYQLCHLLNELNENAFVWIEGGPPHVLYEQFNTPIASVQDLEDAIVIYPEIVDGNPLGAVNVVRWLLHRPGFHTGNVNFGRNELVFGYKKEFSGSGIEINEENILNIKYLMTDIYKQTNFESRSATCYMIKKGKSKKIVHNIDDSKLIDNLSHSEVCKIFNESKFFISYDPYTFYSVYASLCGCISIVVPDENVAEEDWLSCEADRYGIAYGFDDIEYALETKPLMEIYLKSQEEENIKSIRNFIKKCNKYFV